MSAPAGELNYAAKLKQVDVDRIRARHAAGERQRAIADDYPVSHVMIHKIVTWKAWNKRP